MTLLQACDKAPTEAADKGSVAQESASTATASAPQQQAPKIQEKPVKLSAAYTSPIWYTPEI